MSGKHRVFTKEFKEGVAQRIVNGESVSALHQEFQIKRSVLYRWRDAYRKDGAAGLQRSPGRPPGIPNPPRETGDGRNRGRTGRFHGFQRSTTTKRQRAGMPIHHLSEPYCITPKFPKTAPPSRCRGRNSADGIFRLAHADYHPAVRSPSSRWARPGTCRTHPQSESTRPT